MRTRRFVSACLLVVSATVATACGGGSPEPTFVAAPGNTATLTDFATQRITIGGVDYEAYMAVTPQEQSRGLRFANADELAPLSDGTPRGMLFTFPTDRRVAFVMTNTYIPLDIAFIRGDGTIVEIVPMQPLSDALVWPSEPILFAFEATQGELAAKGVMPGDKLTLPLGP